MNPTNVPTNPANLQPFKIGFILTWLLFFFSVLSYLSKDWSPNIDASYDTNTNYQAKLPPWDILWSSDQRWHGIVLCLQYLKQEISDLFIIF